MRSMMPRSIPNLAFAALAAAGISACASSEVARVPGDRGVTPAVGQTGTRPARPPASCPAAAALAPPRLPAALAPPAGATLAMRLHAEGSQIYVCKASAPATGGATAFGWTLKAPDARLFDAACHQVGTHFGGPTWQWSADGSTVVGVKVADAAASGTIPWLLLAARANAGKGVFSPITAVQRVDTVGGLAPTTGCDAAAEGQEQPVGYSANYYFYSQARTR
jgi:hypothetical protein